MPHRGLERRAFQHIFSAIQYGMQLAYIGQFSPKKPITSHTPTKQRRNTEIRARYAAGDTVEHLARLFGISPQRVSQIVRGKRA
jgi:hypothetical protein